MIEPIYLHPSGKYKKITPMSSTDASQGPATLCEIAGAEKVHIDRGRGGKLKRTRTPGVHVGVRQERSQSRQGHQRQPNGRPTLSESESCGFTGTASLQYGMAYVTREVPT